jgi:VWFA-related protein
MIRGKAGASKTTVAGGGLALFLAAGLLGLWTLAAPPTRAQNSAAGAPTQAAASDSDPQADDTSDLTPVIRALSNIVVTPVTVMDRDGQFLYELKKSDFEVYDNGEPQHIEGFESEPRRMAAVIVIQTSRSVGPLLDPVKALGPEFSSLLLGPEGRVAVVTYSDLVKVAQDFSSDGDQLNTTLGKIVPEGVNARLNDALARAIGLLERRPKTERRIIVAFSDGFDDGSETQRREVIRRATGMEVQICGLGFNPARSLWSRKPEVSAPSPIAANAGIPLPSGGMPTPTASANILDAGIPIVDILDTTGKVVRSTLLSNLLEVYTGYTGGVYYSQWKKTTFSEELAHLAAEAHSQYELAYVPNTLSTPGFHRIEVKVRRSGVKVRARAGYFFQAPTTPSKPPEPDKTTPAQQTQ